ncbi:MAG TPA: hypothetical protein PK514_11710 [Spirochaetota bacterium]|nr:hypothetical protein [Spirochaetota bacterium]
MKISINPLRTTEKECHSMLRKNMNDMQDVLSRVRTALNRQKQVLDSLDKLNRTTDHDDSGLAALADELDKAALECTGAGVPLLDGRYSRGGMSSMWYASGFRSWNIERVYLGTMTSAGLGIRPAGQKQVNTENLHYACSRVNKQLADVEGYSSRIRFTENAWKDTPLASYSSIRLERGMMEHQVEMIRAAKNGMAAAHAVLNRIKELAEKSAGRKPAECLYMQVEVSALVDEVDRIASQTEFNKFKLLTGNYAKVNPRASMWFLTGKDSQEKERVFIQTMTAYSLGLKQDGYCRISLTGGEPGLSAAKLLINNSIEKTSEGISSMDRIITLLEKSEDLNIRDVMMKEIVL